MAPDDRVPAPIVFAEPASPRDLTPAKRAARDSLQRDFVARLGLQDPADPDYASRWENARTASNEQFRARFGDMAFLQLQREQMARHSDEP